MGRVPKRQHAAMTVTRPQVDREYTNRRVREIATNLRQAALEASRDIMEGRLDFDQAEEWLESVVVLTAKLTAALDERRAEMRQDMGGDDG